MDRTQKHPLGGLLVAQFTGQFNDNAWKLFIALLAVEAIRAAGDFEPGPAFDKASQTQMTIAFVVFTLPLMLFSLPAGVLSDRISKRSVIIMMKTLEVALMASGTIALLVMPTGGIMLLAVLGMMGMQSALFSPSKYGILPEILPHKQLSEGNGHMEMWSFFGTVSGTAAGGVLLDLTRGSPWVAGLLLTVLAGVGLTSALKVPQVPVARADGGMVMTIRTAWATIRADRVLWLAVLGYTFYWVLVGLLGNTVIVYAKSITAGHPQSNTLSSLPLALFAVGIGVGSLIAGKVSASKVEYGLIPLGAICLAVITFLLGAFTPGLAGTVVLMALLGLASGQIVVPLNALRQWRSPGDCRGAVIALSNVFMFAGLLAGTLGALALSQRDFSIRGIILVTSLVMLCGTIWALWLLPDALLRLVLVLLTHTFYRLKVVGRQHLPEEGPVLLVPNHVTLVDGMILLATTDRPIRFIVESSYFEKPLLRPFLKALGAISISASGGPRVILRALRDAGNYLDQGEAVCIFAEGQMTRTGMLLPFRRGFERIIKGRDAPIVPMYLDRLWGSIFSRERGRYIFKFPHRVPYPVTVAFGEQLQSGTTAAEVRRSVTELGEASWEHRRPDRPSLHRSFIRAARCSPFRMAFADATRPSVSFISALAGSIILVKKLRPHWRDQPYVGILLPPSVGGALVNIAATMAGRTTVNLNYTAGQAGMESAARQTQLRTVVSSREFIEKAKVEIPENIEMIWLEDIAATIGTGSRLGALLLAILAPVRMLERLCGSGRKIDNDDVATVIFSSGSTGEPKGVLLTHFNIDSNVEAIGQVFRGEPSDRLMGILPFFHSFGTMSLWFAINQRIGVVFHPNPLDAAAISQLIQDYEVTLLLATPTFLQIYLRRCTPAQFGSLRLVLAGAERLSERLELAFEDHFGIRPLQGYGATECAPVIATSTLDYRAPGFFQPGARRGFVGIPLPGVAVRIVDPDTFETLEPLNDGMIIVKGPNVMKGYLGRDDLTEEALKDGWYITGDIGMLDEDGFLKITDRLSRFSKIGGEMVPHGRVEEALQHAAGSDLQVFAVSSVPDEKKGERLAILYTLKEDDLPGIIKNLSDSGLPNLFLPKQDQFIKVDELPLLGTGKLDLREVKRIAEEKT